MNIVILIDLIRRGQYDLARYLIYTRGYPLNLRDNRGNTALSWATKFNLPNMVRILCMNGALIDNQDDYFRRIFEFLNVENMPVTSSMKKITDDNMRNVLLNYEEIKEHFKNTEYENMFDEKE